MPDRYENLRGKGTHLLLRSIDLPDYVRAALIDFTPWRTSPATLFLDHLAAVSAVGRNAQVMRTHDM